MTAAGENIVISNSSEGVDENIDNGFTNDGPLAESQHTDTQTQVEFTQLTQTQPGLTPDESSNFMSISSSGNHTPLSPPMVLPYGRLVPCVPSEKLTAIDLMPTQESYWLGRSQKCDVTARFSSNKADELSKKDVLALEWGKSMISNRHCRIFQQNNGAQIFVEDNSGNGTFINQQTKLGKGETRILHSGDEICLINMETLRKRISSDRVIQMVLQQFSFIVVQSKPRKPCVNPRAMNYNFNFGRNHWNGSIDKSAPPLSPTRKAERIETFYDMREVLGDGTSGQVRRAIHRQSGKERAVKIVSLRRNLNVDMMEREVDLLRSLDHPYIVRLVEVFVQRGVAMYLVMELVKGGDLFDSIVDKLRYTEVEARRAMRRILSAVYYLHEVANVVHRDLKPENILCSSPTHVKLADFGLAKIMNADGLKTFCGTPAYFAPEVLERRATVAGRGRYGKPADIWSLGVILYILLTGKPPFNADMDASSASYEVDFQSDAGVWSKIAPARDLVEKMLAQDPRQRLTVRQACDHSWINTEDGDTHRNPLDDPVVVTAANTKKEQTPKITNPADNTTTNATAQIDGDRDKQTSVVSKDVGVESKEESTAVASSQEQDIGILRDPDTTSLNSKTADAHHSSPKTGTGGTESNADLGEGNCDDTKREGECGNDGTTESKSPDANKTVKNEQSNNGVSFSDTTCSPPRSSLTRLNMNERSNKFRDQVINQTQGRSDSPNGSVEQQAAVTPTSSNMKPKRQLEQKKVEVEGEDGEDPILSQFSSEVSSVGSFSDNESMANEATKADRSQAVSDSKKRPLDEGATKKSTKPSKRTKTCSSKQTTLNAWLVKKN